MVIFGKPLSAYVSFARVFLVLVLLIGLTRLVLSLNGVPNETARWFSMTVFGFVGVVYFGIRVHTSGFGSYKQLLVVVALQNLMAQVVAIIGIVTAIVTNTNNIFSSPEFAFGSDGKTWLHVAAHVCIGTTVGSLFPWLIGSAVMFVTKKVSPR